MHPRPHGLSNGGDGGQLARPPGASPHRSWPAHSRPQLAQPARPRPSPATRPPPGRSNRAGLSRAPCCQAATSHSHGPPADASAARANDTRRDALADAVREDYLSSYEGDRFVESMRYVRAYPAELPVLRDLLPEIQTPVQIIAGGQDTAVPPVNGEFLHERLPQSKLEIIDAGHFTWEDAADEYAALVTSWWGGGYATTASAAAR
jgi:pimeloyl-ACP methyl ester carboxylesterase